MKKIHISPTIDRCVVCGTVVPEGRQVCPNCEKGRVNLPQSRGRKKSSIYKLMEHNREN